MAELKRCPFCGQLPITKVEIRGTNIDGYDLVDFGVVCEKCGTEKIVRLKINRRGATFVDVEESMEKVKAAWNTRYDYDKEAQNG